jgi:hypothetical protein
MMRQRITECGETERKNMPRRSVGGQILEMEERWALGPRKKGARESEHVPHQMGSIGMHPWLPWDGGEEKSWQAP